MNSARTSSGSQSRSPKGAHPLLIYVVAFVVAVFVFAALHDDHERSIRDREEHEAAVAAQEHTRKLVEQQAEADHAFKAMTPAEHLAAAKGLVTADASPSALNQAEYHLNAIPADSPQSRSATELRSRIHAMIRRRTAESETLNNQAAETARIEFAKTVQNQMLDEGLDFDVVALGAKHTTLRMKWFRASKAVAHQIGENAQMIETARELGFKRMELTNGFDQTWSWNLQ